jgi:hypothetical protein
MQLFVGALAPFAVLAVAHASPFEARSAPSAVPVPVTDGSKALAQAQPAGLATSKAAMGGVPGAAIPAGLEPHDLTSNAAQSDPLLYICSKQKCGGTCMYFDLTTLTPNTCYSPTTPFPFLSTFINDGNAPLAYEVCSRGRRDPRRD